ncbi:MAG: diguanylate cyclase [Spirulina sp. SIO3F2]|nr:diguanylate cyclase [Spirulina sp. SIO3F2]
MNDPPCIANPTPENAHHRGDILIVDDVPENLQVLFLMLSEQNYAVRRVRSGQQALNVVNHDPPDLILLDIRMPGLDGYEVCSRIKSNPDTQQIPIIFLSALNHTLDKVKAFTVGGADYISKPFQAEEVFARIENQLTIQRQHHMLDVERARLSNIIEAARLGTWEWNIQTGETIFNDRWAEIIGYEPNEVQSVTMAVWITLIHPDDLEKSQKLMANHFKGTQDFYDIEYRIKHKDGHWIWVHDRGKVIQWDSQRKPLMMFGTHSDITEKKEMEHQIRELSIRDPLTNTYNRRYILERLKQNLLRFKQDEMPFSIALIDIDHFKNVNDFYSHLTGDYILKEFTRIINKNIEKYDLLGRYGGEEFIVVGYDQAGTATVKLEYLLKVVRDTVFEHEENSIKITFSGGVAEACDFADEFSIEEMISAADKRLYLAKELGRNRIIDAKRHTREHVVS